MLGSIDSLLLFIAVVAVVGFGAMLFTVVTVMSAMAEVCGNFPGM
jgi:hypothetical protein